MYIYFSSVFDSVNMVYQVWTEDSNSFMNKTGNMTSDPSRELHNQFHEGRRDEVDAQTIEDLVKERANVNSFYEVRKTMRGLSFVVLLFACICSTL